MKMLASAFIVALLAVGLAASDERSDVMRPVHRVIL